MVSYNKMTLTSVFTIFVAGLSPRLTSCGSLSTKMAKVASRVKLLQIPANLMMYIIYLFSAHFVLHFSFEVSCVVVIVMKELQMFFDFNHYCI